MTQSYANLHNDTIENMDYDQITLHNAGTPESYVDSFTYPYHMYIPYAINEATYLFYIYYKILKCRSSL